MGFLQLWYCTGWSPPFPAVRVSTLLPESSPEPAFTLHKKTPVAESLKSNPACHSNLSTSVLKQPFWLSFSHVLLRAPSRPVQGHRHHPLLPDVTCAPTSRDPIPVLPGTLAHTWHIFQETAAVSLLPSWEIFFLLLMLSKHLIYALLTALVPFFTVVQRGQLDKAQWFLSPPSACRPCHPSRMNLSRALRLPSASDSSSAKWGDHWIGVRNTVIQSCTCHMAGAPKCKLRNCYTVDQLRY